MPEGDTIARAAATLETWLGGRIITAVDARDPLVRGRAEALVGGRVGRVEARAKHLLIHVGDALVVHTHMRMTGSWHVYGRGARWRKRRDSARLVLTAGDRLAVCFDAPIVHVLSIKDLGRVPGLATLGPDVLTGLDPGVGARLIRRLDPSTPAGDALLDQRVVSGLGNIWRCEALFAVGVHPATPVGALVDATLAGLVKAGADLMGRSANGARRRPPAQVYGRTGRPCRRCGALIAARRMGRDARTAYWCPGCQVQPTGTDLSLNYPSPVPMDRYEPVSGDPRRSQSPRRRTP